MALMTPRMETIKMPLAIPNAPPSALALTEMQKSPETDAANMSIVLRRTGNTAPGQARLEPNVVAPVMQPFVVHNAM